VKTKRKKKIREPINSTEVADVIIDRAALNRIKEIAIRKAAHDVFPKNLDQKDLQYYLMFESLADYLGERKVTVPFEVRLETQNA